MARIPSQQAFRTSLTEEQEHTIPIAPGRTAITSPHYCTPDWGVLNVANRFESEPDEVSAVLHDDHG